MNILETENLCKNFKDKIALDDISFIVAEGEIFGLLGPNGAGKTTLLRLIMGYFLPDRGSIKVLGSSPGSRTRHLIGYLPEESGLYRRATVLDMFKYISTLHGMNSRQATERAIELTRQMGLYDRRKSKIQELSHGNLQRVQLGIAIIHNPRFLLLDEIFSGLDPVYVSHLTTFLLGLKDQGITMILSSHQMNLLERLCTRFLMLNNGRTVLYGSTEEIRKQFPSEVILLRSRGPENIIRDFGGIPTGKKHEWKISLRERGPEEILRELLGRGVSVESFFRLDLSLEEIFVRLAGEPADSVNEKAKTNA